MRPSEIVPTEILDRNYSKTAATTSIALSLLGAALLVVWMILDKEMSAVATAYLTTWIVLLAIVIAAGVAVLRGQVWAQRFSLIYYVVVAGAALVTGAAALMPGGATWWQEWVPMALVVVPVLAAAGGATVLFVLASAPASRLRYASVVAATIGAAVTLVVVVNLVAHLMAQSEFLRPNIETSSHYGVSQRTKRIISTLSTPVTLTCAYTSADKEGKKISSKYGPRTFELLEDIADLSDQTEAVNANTDSAKARVIARLRRQLVAKAQKHMEFLRQFAADGDLIAKGLAKQAQQWQEPSRTAYLDQWGMSVEIARLLNKLSTDAEDACEKVNEELSGSGLPDYAKMCDDAKTSLKDTQDTLKQLAELLARIYEIPFEVEENSKGALKRTTSCIEAASAMVRAIGAPENPVRRPSNPSSVLRKFVTAARETARKARSAARALKDIGGQKNAQIVASTPVWRMELTARTGIMFRGSLADFYSLQAQTIDRLVADAEGLIEAAKPDYQADIIVEMQPQVVALAISFNETHDKVSEAITALVTVDKQTREILNQAEKKELFKDLLKRCSDLFAHADKLPELKSSSLTIDITGDNIVIVEVAGNAEVVEFSAIWPLRSQARRPGAPPDTEQRRVFNGDTAINSKILSLTSKPFATVLLTYYRPALPPQMQRMVPQAEIEPWDLSTLKKRLEEANFLVKDWNLGEDMPKPLPDEPPTQVLIVLPPPPAMPGPMGGQGMGQFGPLHVHRIREAVDSGIHAIFLTMFSYPRVSMYGPPMYPPYGLNGYLKKDWGITALTNYLVVPAVVDENDLEKFKINEQRYRYLPLNNFSSHAIGKPLRRQRVLWTTLCPIRTDPTLPEGVTVQPLLSIPGDWRDTWATPRFEELVQQFSSGEGSKVYPNYDYDLRVPFDVAVTATRAASTPAQTQPTTTQAATAPEQHRAKSARIVVLGMARSLTDSYLGQPLVIKDAKGTITLADPPRANADVVINSVYWMTGRENYIAAGPAGTQLVLIGNVTRTVLVIIFVVALPILVLAAGTTVMVMRRR